MMECASLGTVGTYRGLLYRMLRKTGKQRQSKWMKLALLNTKPQCYQRSTVTPRSLALFEKLTDAKLVKKFL